MDVMQIIFSVVLIVLAIVLTVVGVQLVTVLIEARRTLRRVNQSLETIEAKVSAFTQPLMALGGAVTGLRSGMKIFELFVTWLNRNNNESKQ